MSQQPPFIFLLLAALSAQFFPVQLIPLHPSSTVESQVNLEPDLSTISAPQDLTPDQILMLKERLRRVFKLDESILWRNQPDNLEVAPDYMLDLYKQTADAQSGLTRAGKPYNATLVHSFHNKGLRNENHFWFDVGKMRSSQDFDEAEKNITMVGAEFHVFKHVKRNKTTTTHPPKHDFVELRLHYVSFSSGSQKSELVESRIISSQGSGWEVFNVFNLVQFWLDNPHDNFGFFITFKGLDGTDLKAKSLGMELIVQSKAKHSPLLVAFCQEDGDKKEYAEFQDQESLLSSVPEKKDFMSNRKRRSGTVSPEADTSTFTDSTEFQQQQRRPHYGFDRMMADQQPPWSQRRNCERLPLYVDFYEIGWSGWIISPSGYNAYYCQGECPFPLGQMHRPSNHATVQSIVNAIGPKSESGYRIPQPCCVPDKLYSISLLYFDDSGDVILKQYDDMVAASCGCH